MIILITIIFVLITTLVPSKVYATKSSGTLLGDLVSKIGNSAASAIGFSRGLSGDSDWGLENIPGNLLKELGYLFVALGDIGMSAMQVTLLGDANFWIGTMISNKNDNLEDTSSWLYADQSDVDALEAGRPEDARGSMLVVASDAGLKNGIFSGHWKVPNILYSPENIFANRIAALDANYINPHEYTAVRDSEEAEREATSFAESISPTIASWYRAFRNIAIVGLLSVLVYIGIRIVIGTVSEKAKYKERLQDWFIALCLVLFMHFIMAGIMMLAEKITDLFNNAINSGIIVAVDDGTIFRTTFTGYIRFASQSDAWTEAIGYAIMYLCIVGITLRYTFIYIKRALYLAFFTMIAPLVALTYPIDKIKDGHSQAFDMWIKEYFINAIIQPVHLVLYCALVGAAMSLVVQNPIYGIVALLFMSTAEKWIKKMFKIDQAQLTSSSLGDVALLGSILGLGSKVVGGVAKAAVTVGTAGAGAAAAGVASSALGAPFRAGMGIAKGVGGAIGGAVDMARGALGNNVEDTVNGDSSTDERGSSNNSIVNVNNNVVNNSSGLDDFRNKVDDKNLNNSQNQEGDEEARRKKATDQIRDNLKNDMDNSDNLQDAINNLSNSNLDDMYQANSNQQNSLDDLANKDISTVNVNNINSSITNSDTTTNNTNSDTTSGTSTEEKSNVRQNSPYEEAKQKSEKIESLKKKEGSDEVKDMINKGLVGAASAIASVPAAAFMSAATGDNKMMLATALGGASLGAGLAGAKQQTTDTRTGENIKVLVKVAGIKNEEIIKNTAQVAVNEKWSSEKMQLVAKIAESYPDLQKNKDAQKEVKELLKANGVKSEKLIEKALKDVYKVQPKQSESKNNNNVERWK